MSAKIFGHEVQGMRGIVGDAFVSLGNKYDRMLVIDAETNTATNCSVFAKAFPERFINVGIAEQHALTFCCGLASQGMIPVFAVYSTFLQRCYDQIIHDAAIERKHIVICVDRAGFVGEDGETHQGLFDVSMLTSIPGITIFSPSDASSLKASLNKALYECDGIAIVRYPKGYSVNHNYPDFNSFIYSGKNNSHLLISYGRVSDNIKDIEGADSLALNQICPVEDEIFNIVMSYDKVSFFEEGIKSGGIGEKLMCRLYSNGYKGEFNIIAVDNEFVKAADTESQLARYGLDRKSISDRVKNENQN